MGRGGYLGGSTTIGPGSGWFSRSKPRPTKGERKAAPTQQEAAEKVAARRREEQKRQEKIREAAAREKAEKAKLQQARRADPGYRARKKFEALRRDRAETSRIAGEQRRSLVTGGQRPTERSIASGSAPNLPQRQSAKRVRLTTLDIPHFEFGNQTCEITLSRVGPKAYELSRAGGPAVVARLLNEAHV